MRVLFFIFFILTSLPTTWANGVINEMSDSYDQEIKNKAVTVAREMRIQNTLINSQEVKKCREEGKISKGATQQQIADAALKTEQCFLNELQNNRKPEELKRLADQLGLESYGLIKSKTSKEISDYLGNALYEKLTGINRADKNQSQRFSDRKLVDQKIFFDLQMNSLNKSVMYEISRYCFENFRKLDSSKDVLAPDGKSFSDYWGFGTPSAVVSANSSMPYDDLTDQGNNSTRFSSTPGTTTEDSYRQLFDTIGDKIDPSVFGKYFEYCAGSIKHFCDEYRKSSTATPTQTASQPVSLAPKGTTSCLVRDRISELRKAIAKTQKAREGLAEKATGGAEITGINVKHFAPDDGDNSIDALTAMTSKDIIEGGKKGKDSKGEDCAKKATKDDCEDFIDIGDDLNNVQLAIDQDLRMKQIVEVERVKALYKEKGQKLKDYLIENGFHEEAQNADTLSESELISLVGKSYQAKREALLSGLRDKLGKRQMTDEESKSNPQALEANIKENAKEVMEERTRLAQVVLFNNIITSHLELRQKIGKDQYKDLGKNINAWKREEQALGSGKIQSTLFQNLKDSAASAGDGAKNEEIDTDFIDQLVLGKTKSP
jgi:hypothetical protein